MKTAAYMRVSTTRQDHKLQLRAMFDWLKAQGLTRRDVQWFRDHGESSAAKSRPGYNRLMAALRTGDYDRLVVWKIDRLNRWEPKDHMRFRLEMDLLGVKVVSLTEADASSFDGLLDMVRELFEAHGRAKWLRDHRDRITAGIRAKRKPGEPWGGARVVSNRPGCMSKNPSKDALRKRAERAAKRAARA